MAKKSSRSSKNESSIAKTLTFPSQIKDVFLFFQLLKIELNHRNLNKFSSQRYAEAMLRLVFFDSNERNNHCDNVSHSPPKSRLRASQPFKLPLSLAQRLSTKAIENGPLD